MSEPDEADMEAIVAAIRPQSQGDGTSITVAAVLATPVVADWRRDAETLAKVQAIVDEPIYQADVEAVYRVRYHRIAEMIGGQS